MSSTEPVPSFISFDPTSPDLSINTQTNLDLGTYDLELVVTEPDTVLTSVHSITLEIIESHCVETLAFAVNDSAIYYMVGQNERTYDLSTPSATFIYEPCDYGLTYVLMMSNPGETMPDFVTYDSTNHRIVIDTDSNSDAASYEMKLVATDSDSGLEALHFITIQVQE